MKRILLILLVVISLASCTKTANIMVEQRYQYQGNDPVISIVFVTDFKYQRAYELNDYVERLKQTYKNRTNWIEYTQYSTISEYYGYEIIVTR